MKTDNFWLQRETLRKAAKMIAHDFFPRPARKDIRSTCMALGYDILAKYNKEQHGELWPWIFLNMLANVDEAMCAMMILVVCQSKIQWQRELAMQCLSNRRESAVSKPRQMDVVNQHRS